jgi:modulator of FtsH protease HflK
MQDENSNVTPIRRKRPPEHPIEELKEIMRKFFGGGGGGGGSGNGGDRGGASRDGSPKDIRIPLLILVGLIALTGVFTSFYTVDVSEEGVVTRFGAYHRTAPSGMHFKFPFGLERVHKVQSKRILQEEFGFRTREVRGERGSTFDKQQYVHESLMLTGDLNVADVEWILQYRISDPWKYLFHARDVQRNIRDISMSIMRRVVGDRLVGDVLTTGRVEIADQARTLSQEVLDHYDMGIHVERIILQGVNPPEKVKPSFHEVNAAKQEQEQTINLAEREYNRVIPEARGKGEKLVSDAEGFAIDVVNRARGNASRFEQVLNEYRRAPEITRRRMYIDTMEEIFSNVERFTVIDSQVKGVLPIYALPALSGQPSTNPTSPKTAERRPAGEQGN